MDFASAFGRAGTGGDAGSRLYCVIVSRLSAARALLAERGHGAVDQPRIELLQILVAQAQRLERAGAVILDEHVRILRQRLEDLAPLLRLEIERLLEPWVR